MALSSVIYYAIFALNRIFPPANEKGTLKQHNQTDFKSCVVTNQIAGKVDVIKW